MGSASCAVPSRRPVTNHSIINRAHAGETAVAYAGPSDARSALDSDERKSWTNRRVSVFGPAYLDRVLRVDQPLIDPARASPGSERRRRVEVRCESIARARRSRRLRDRGRAAGRLAGPDRFDPPGTQPIRPGVTGQSDGARGCPGTTTSAGWGPATRRRSAAGLLALGIRLRPDEPGDLASTGRSWHRSRADSRARSRRRLDLARHQR